MTLINILFYIDSNTNIRKAYNKKEDEDRRRKNDN